MNRRTVMNLVQACAITLAALLSGSAVAAAPPELAGTWQGKLAVDAKTSLAVQFTFTKAANGSYTAVLNSPDNADIKNTPVTGVTWDGSSLKLQVLSLSGSYAGTLKDGKIGGQWAQPGSAIALELAPFQKPVITATTMKALDGSWSGTLTVPPGIKQNVVFKFKQAADGGLEGTFNIPDQGFSTPMANVAFANGELSLKVPRANINYTGKVAGNQITGKVVMPNNPSMPADGLQLDMKRGDYKPPTVALKLSAEAFTALKGKWQGTLEVTNRVTGNKTQLPLVLRFEANAKGEYLGFVDSPSQGAKDLVVTEAALNGDKLVVKIAVVGGEFSGTLAGNTLTGEWAQAAAGLKAPLTLTR
ncbi:MAG: hypothetical protein ABIQ86_12335 [Steroidobacteraceae bacterium]